MATLIDFSTPAQLASWRSINDVVMGGRSSSRCTATGKGMLFSGTVSFENRGGFASIRSAHVELDPAGSRGLRLHCRGDGKRYKLSLRLDRAFDGISWQVHFATDGSWQDIAFPWQAFRPSYHGREVTSPPAFDPARIASVGFLIADRQEGPFRLELARLELLPEAG